MQEQISIQDLANVNIEYMNKEELVDVSTLPFNMTIQQEERASQIFETFKNPYCFRVGNIGVKLEFSNDAPRLQDIFTDFLKRKKGGI